MYSVLSIVIRMVLTAIILNDEDYVTAFVNSPKIITRDGNLIFESGLNRNISFRLSGNSRVTINDDYDLLNLLMFNKMGRRNGRIDGSTWTDIDDVSIAQLNQDVLALKARAFGAGGLNDRVRGLQNRTRNNNQLMVRYQARLDRVEHRVQLLYELLEKDNCKSNPCENGGSCLNIFNGFMCRCTTNFEGDKCEKDVNECALLAGTDLGCQNGAQCVNQFGGYSCICTPGWFGVHCSQRKGDCMQSSTWELCGHGTCVSSSDSFGYKCICDQGWTTNGLTPSCMVDVDECTASNPPCVTSCINLQGSFSCGACANGLTGNGVNCRDIDECAYENGGCSVRPKVPCINTYGSYHCGECPTGWQGDGRSCVRSSTNENSVSLTCAGENICHPDATCTEISNTVVCTCPTGMVGSGIGPNGCLRSRVVDCSTQPCQNGATCVDGENGYICSCPLGFGGVDCGRIFNPCIPNPCSNGQCVRDGTMNFKCQCHVGYSGRLCDSHVGRCGGLLVGDTGRLKYPENSMYEHNAQCAWLLRTNDTKVLNVTFINFELEDSTECRFDWLQINDGRTAAAQIIGRFCGTHKPQGGNIISTTNNLYLWFRSDNSTARAGFELEWNSITPQCGGIIDVESYGTIATPGSPGNYPKNRDCRWQLRAANDKRIKLTFFSLQIEIHDSCNFDYIEITDSISNEVLAKYCNTSSPAPLMLPTNEATILFHSDNEGGDTGFQLHYSIEARVPGCGGTFTAGQGIIRSPTILDGSISCEYDIKMPASESVTIEFTKFEMWPDDCIEFYDVNAEKQIKILQAKYCGDNTVTPVFHSTFNVIQLKYYSKRGQFELKYRADCSYTYESSSDVIQSPDYPSLGNTERFCVYKIKTEPNTVIELKIADFELKDSGSDDGECPYTYLKIIDGLQGGESVAYCSQKEPPTDLVSKTNMLQIYLQSGTTSSGRGFKIEYKAVPMGLRDCGGVYTKENQTIRLPTGDDGNYFDDMECYWIIMAPRRMGIAIHWNSFNLNLRQYSPDCFYDYIEIYDNLANLEDSKPLGSRFCNSRPPPEFVSHSSILTLKFVSDYSDGADGFEATFKFVDLTKTCGGELFSSSGTIATPNYPENYTNGMDCIWTITAPHLTQIELQIEKFDLEDSDACTSDWLEIRNGGSPNASLVGSFCGSSIPRAIPSFTHQMWLHFHSNSFLSGSGFRISWSVFSNGCGGNLKGQRGTITSPMYPSAYPNKVECDWYVYVKRGSFIHFTIEDMAMEELMHCDLDSLTIFNSRSESDIALVKLCSRQQDTPKHIETSNNEALVRFTSDISTSYRGFLLSYYADCNTNITDLHGAIESPNYDSPYVGDEVNCTWTIQAPKGNHIALELTFYDSKDPEQFLYMTEYTRSGLVNHVIKGRQSLNTAGNVLVVRQNSSALSFRLEYAVVGCVQLFHRESGQFNSPNFPKPYPNDVECIWEIKTSLGNGIELTIEDMDIEDSVDCTKDALQISHHLTSDHLKERHCGKHATLRVDVSSHRLYVRFTSNGANNGKGFNATYRTKESECGGLMQSKNGIIQSPNYPSNYPANVDCEWNIIVTDHHTITFTLEELDLEQYQGCEMDYLELYEQTGDDDEDSARHKLFTICGSLNSHSTMERTTHTSRAVVRFVTDEGKEFKGFKLSFKENCGERIIVDTDHSDYLSVIRNKEINETCEWQLIAKDPAKHIIFTTTHVQLSPLMALSYQNEGDCNEVGVKIFDGENDKAPLRSKFCKVHPPALTSNGHALTIKVPLNFISEFEGQFYILDSFCGAYYDAITGKFATPYYPSSYPVNMECEWFIVANAGNSIVLTFETMDLETSDECNHDYVEVRESNSLGPLMGVFCGSTTPPPIKAVSELYILFRSDDNNVGRGFLASYNYAFHNEINGTNGTIESPKYPSKFSSPDPYTWRITVNRDYVVLLSIAHIVDVDIPHIKFYDGYSDIGAPIDYADTHTIRSNTNVLYFTATRGPFQFQWERFSKAALRSNETAAESSNICGKSLITINSTLVFTSPGYPFGYAPNLDCSWTFASADRRSHATLQFLKVELEEFGDCRADYVAISASTDVQNWQQLDKMCKKPAETIKLYHGTPYLKLDFVTDFTTNKTGFSAYVKTSCGSELTGRSDFVNITSLAFGASYMHMECLWTIRVSRGHRLRLTFDDLFLKNANDTTSCNAYFILRNGVSGDSPFLGNGKYCDSEIPELVTTSHHAFIKFTRNGFPRFRAAFRYEEIKNECSEVVELKEDTPTERVRNITSPHYPNLPNPHSECVWRITAPIHHVIAIEFLEKFDLAAGVPPIVDKNCESEYVQLNDGSTELMPLIGKYCGTTKPDSKMTTGNVLRMKYFTDVSEPHMGFKAQVSIGRCGGSYYSSEGVISSPPDRLLPRTESEFECDYTIEVDRGSTIQVNFEKLHLGYADNCSEVTHIELQEVETYDNSISDTLQICGNEGSRYLIETNKVIVKYRVKLAHFDSSMMFKMSYVTIGSRCGETIVASRGILQTPGYPNGVTRPTRCNWQIRVPKGRRIRIDFLDFDTGAPANATSFSGQARTFRGRLTFANDFDMQSIIQRVFEDPPSKLYSTDNTMAIDAFLLSFSRHRGFKLRFSSDEPTELCPQDVRIVTDRTFHVERGRNDSLYCSQYMRMDNNETLVLQIENYEKYEELPSYINAQICASIAPLKIELNKERILPQLLCSNDTIRTLRFPFPVTVTMSGHSRNRLHKYDLHYHVYKCGGIVPIMASNNVTIRQPVMAANSGRLECAWAVWPNDKFDVDNIEDLEFWMEGAQIEISLAVDFKGKCEDQYLILYNGPNQNAPHLGKFCSQSSATNLVVEQGLFFEYVSNNYELQSSFNLTLAHGSGCGGQLKYPYRDIRVKEQYKINTECIWEIESEPGFHLGLNFIDRFFIESSSGCKKDYLLVQQLNTTGEWVDLQRLCGRSRPQTINSTANHMRLIFRTDGDTNAEGFTAHFQRNCGGTLYATDTIQTLVSPGYPDNYDNILHCNYTILPTDNAKAGVLVQFTDFELEDAPIGKCLFDNVTIITDDDDGKVEEQTLCGRHKLPEFRAKRKITLVFHTDHSYTARGFSLEYSTKLCGGLITNSTIINSPRHYTHGTYPHSSSCYWSITAPAGYKILVKFEELDFEGSWQCWHDGVELYKGLNRSEEQRMGKFCGNLTGTIPQISIPTHTAMIHSYSDSHVSSRGFIALVNFVKNCDRDILLGKDNATFEFNNFAGNYGNDLNCAYKFLTEVGYQFQIRFSSFHLEDTANCDADYLEIRDGAGTFADLIGRFCGHSTPVDLMSSRNSLFMNFITDQSVTSTGFSATITAIPSSYRCGNHHMEIKDNEKVVLQSPMDANGLYPKNLNCLWTIKADKFIHLKFDKLDIDGLRPNNTCGGDYLKIYNREDADIIAKGFNSELIINGHLSSTNYMGFSTEYVYCGNELPDDYFAVSNQVLIKFVTDNEGAKSGFTLSAMKATGCFRNFTGTQGRIHIADTTDHCDIYINAPRNYSLSLFYNDVHLSDYHCTAEYVEVFDAQKNVSLQKACGYIELGKGLFTHSNQLRIRIKIKTHTQYDMTWLASPYGPGCGGDLYNTQGIITNAFYPNNESNSTDCRWNIRVPNNVQVLLNFLVFNLGAKTTCHSDYVQIIEHDDAGTETVVRQFCGGDEPRYYKSPRSFVTIRFHKTVNYDGTGWVLRFNGVPANYKIPE